MNNSNSTIFNHMKSLAILSYIEFNKFPDLITQNYAVRTLLTFSKRTLLMLHKNFNYLTVEFLTILDFHISFIFVKLLRLRLRLISFALCRTRWW